MTKLSGEHGTFNRISFGDALWNSVIRPSISHGGVVWLPSSISSRGLLESWQYKTAKLIFNTNMNVPKSAFLLELGWEPINDFLDRQMVSYFSRLKQLPSSRLCKIIFNELQYTEDLSPWTYMHHMKNIFNNVGLDHYLDSEINMNTFR